MVRCKDFAARHWTTSTPHFTFFGLSFTHGQGVLFHPHMHNRKPQLALSGVFPSYIYNNCPRPNNLFDCVSSRRVRPLSDMIVRKINSNIYSVFIINNPLQGWVSEKWAGRKEGAVVNDTGRYGGNEGVRERWWKNWDMRGQELRKGFG